MNRKKIIVVVLVAIVATLGLALLVGSDNSKGKTSLLQKPLMKPQRTEPTRVPAYMTDGTALASLRPTLPPEQFFGKAREAYIVAREIPETLAQLPCYCYCDEGFGHKSLHTCYESDHSAHCATCIQEALVAYRLQKEDGLSPAQIRERIIADFGPK
ncbi:MAG TPA: CYCXC family (seleno)protein [Pyrinomonadaceae bacterium]|nr:CYCXC family (seleno)protein [Pyrinomonadaceae bacterium]